MPGKVKADYERVLQLFREGLTAAEIAPRFGLSAHQVRRIIINGGLRAPHKRRKNHD
jgi:DNA invertase Pin-like site-specific DNA recombinase